MSKTFSAKAIILIFLVIAVVSNAQETTITQERIRVKSMIGKVSVRSPQSQNWRDARPGMPVKPGWDIRTFVESNAELEFSTGSVLKIGENSVVTISSAKQNTKTGATSSNVKISTGDLWANVRKLVDKNSKFEFETPTAVASIRGTRLGLNVGKQGTSLEVYDGVVMFKKKGSNKEIPVIKNTRAVAKKGKDDIEIFQGSATGQNDPFDGDSSEADTSGGRDTSSTGGEESTTGSLNLEILYPRDGQVLTETPVVVTGKTSPNATAVVSGEEASVSSDGSFAAVVDLSAGTNAITIRVSSDNETADKRLTVEYHPPIYINVSNIVDNMEVSSQTMELDIEVSEGAQFSVNGKPNAKTVSLSPGSNVITVAAWDSWGSREEMAFTVIYTEESGFTLNVAAPTDGAVVTEPLITVSGSTRPGARVKVNGAAVSPGGSGFFTYKAYIPDEEGDYVIQISAEYGGEELTVERNVEYHPPKEPLKLVITSPAEGQSVSQQTIKVMGITSPRATIIANGRNVNASANGTFTVYIPVTERDIGDYALEVTANDEEEELVETINLTIDPTSPQVNTSLPTVYMPVQVKKINKTGSLSVQVKDNTPEDRLVLEVSINGSREEYSLDPSSTEYINLEEGKNDYVIRAYDRARNYSNTIAGQIYYVPNPPVIEIVEPSSNPYVIRGLPPMPRNVDRPVMELEIEIDDGIGDIPEIYKNCRVRGSDGQEQVLRSSTDYTYYGEMELTPGQNTQFTIMLEDISGMIETKILQVRFER